MERPSDLVVPRALLSLNERQDRGRWRYSDERVGTGNTENGCNALAVARALTIECGTLGCDALVDLSAARRRAYAAGRSHLKPSDGCSGRGCSRHYRPQKHASRQLKRACELQNSARLLVRRPSSLKLTELSTYVLVNSADTALAACAAKAAAADLLTDMKEASP